MKIRKGFVSNSSSSSYICDVCGENIHCWETPDGWEICSSEDHWLCDECFTYKLPSQIANEIAAGTVDEIIHDLRDYIWSDESEGKFRTELEEASSEKKLLLIEEKLDSEWWIHRSQCPVCSFQIITESDMKRYLKKISGVNEKDVFAEIKKINKRRKKLYDHEYITYVCGKMGKDTIQITQEIQDSFGGYEEFLSSMRN